MHPPAIAQRQMRGRVHHGALEYTAYHLKSYMPNTTNLQPSASSPGVTAKSRGRRLYYYVWLVVKNVIGWALILAAPPIGFIVPGPMGLPLFLIGFAMITLPGKRRLTSRVLRGRPIPENSPHRILGEILAALLLPALIVWILSLRFSEEMQLHGAGIVLTVYTLTVVASWMVVRLAVRAVNYGLTFVPALRRKIRPWMRRKGIDLLPPRRRQRLKRMHGQGGAASSDVDTGILEVDSQRYQDNLKSFWSRARPWIRRGVSLGITLAIFYWLIRKIAMHWSEVKDRAGSVSILSFIVAAFMFALFLFAVRAMSWRRIIKSFGHPLPVAPAVRIWSTSELARYVPGVVLQVYGRMHLARPYGIGGTECAASQILELVIFLLANIIVGVTCMLFFGFRNVQGMAGRWLLGLTAVTPLLLLILHPRVFYGILERVMRWRKKPLLAQRPTGAQLLGLLAWAILGLVWQSVAVFLIIAHPLGLAWSKWYVVAGAYCLAWCAGFVVITAPGGLGVRELVLVLTLSLVLPKYVTNTFKGTGELKAFLTFLGGLLRLWTIAGELIVVAVAYTLDYDGAIGRSPPQHQDHRVKLEVGDVAG
jgi:hypothetical protein